jgi:hypothetical protein
MKWGSVSKNGETRVIVKYAFLPMRIKSIWADNPIQWRWLEKVKIEQEYFTHCNDDINPIKDLKVWIFGGYWKNVRFLEFNKDEIRDEKLKKLGI